jgi:DNA-binding NarL/FixJ family response regulator
MARLPETKVIMLTSYAEDDMLFAAIRAGAVGYVLKQVGSQDVIRAVEAAGRGEAMLDPSLTQRVFQEMRRAIKTDRRRKNEPRNWDRAFSERRDGA